MVKEEIISTFTPEECNNYILSSHGKNLIIIDLRSSDKFRKNRLKNSVNLDYDDDDFEVKLEKLDRNMVYLIYCSWVAKANIVSEMMAELDFKKIYKMKGGINAWHEDGFPLDHDE